MLTEKTKTYLLIFVLLLFSGNPLLSFLFTKYTPFVGLIIALLIINKDLKIDKSFIHTTKIIAFFLLLIGVFQYLQLSLVSVLGMINLLVKFILGGLIIYHLKEKFFPAFFKVIFHLSIVSLLFFIVINLLKTPLPSISLSESANTYFVYGISKGHMHQNAGMFWEPGAYAGILTLCLALNFNHLNYYWKKHRFKLIIVFTTLLSTLSSSGFIVGFVIILFYFIQAKKLSVYFLALPALLFIGLYLYENTDFLKDKIEGQYKVATEQEVGEFSNTRFGSILFDWHYIQKHPFTGNGLLEETRYADHQHLFVGAVGDVVGSGNSFSNFWASLGCFFILGYFYLLWKATSPAGLKFSIIILIIVLLNIQVEQWFNYPLYLGLLFISGISLKKKKAIKIR